MTDDEKCPPRVIHAVAFSKCGKGIDGWDWLIDWLIDWLTDWQTRQYCENSHGMSTHILDIYSAHWLVVFPVYCPWWETVNCPLQAEHSTHKNSNMYTFSAHAYTAEFWLLLHISRWVWCNSAKVLTLIQASLKCSAEVCEWAHKMCTNSSAFLIIQPAVVEGL